MTHLNHPWRQQSHWRKKPRKNLRVVGIASGLALLKHDEAVHGNWQLVKISSRILYDDMSNEKQTHRLNCKKVASTTCSIESMNSFFFFLKSGIYPKPFSNFCGPSFFCWFLVARPLKKVVSSGLGSIDSWMVKFARSGAKFETIYRDRKNGYPPIFSMHGIFTYIYHRFKTNLGKYSIHGAFRPVS